MSHFAAPFRATVLAVFASLATGQCPLQWLPSGGLTGPADGVSASVTWDPDGTGPLPALVVFGGGFTVAGNIAAASVVAYEPVARTWSPLGAGLGGYVAALHVTPNNDLIAGGWFTSSGSAAVNHVARWNGTAWVTLGGGTAGPVSAITSLANGNVVVAGLFASAGGVPANNIARWNGTTWAPLGPGLTGTFGPVPPGPPAPSIRQVVRMPNGNVVASGNFRWAGGSVVDGLAQWNGTAWTGMGVGPSGPSSYAYVHAIAPRANGALVVSVDGSPYGGPLLVGGPLGGWAPLAAPFGNAPTALTELANGTLVAAGIDSLWSLGPSGWTSSGFPPLVGDWFPSTIAEVGPSDLIVAGSSFSGVTAWRSGAAGWSTLSPGTDGPILSMVSDAGGTFAAGWFTQIEGVAASGIAQRVGGTWTPLGAGISGGLAAVTAIARSPSGDLVAAGFFTHAGGVPATNIARWNGTTWSAIGSGAPPPTTVYPYSVGSVLALPNGDVIVGGDSPWSSVPSIARWNGSAWVPLGLGVDGPVWALARMPNGDVVAGGVFGNAGGTPAANIARWNGTAWSPLGPGLGAAPSYDFVAALAVLPNGDLLAGGSFSATANGSTVLTNVARWNGSAWSPLGGGTTSHVHAFAILPGGDVIAAGAMFDSSGAPIKTPQRWNGSSWSTGVAGVDGLYHRVRTMALSPSGELLVGGDFASVQGMPSASFARLVSTCPALATPAGAGCTGTAGPVVLTASSLPWLGGTFASAAATLPPLSLAMAVWGFGTVSIPLASILPQGVPGCSLLVTPDVLELSLPAAGVATTSLAIPATASLIGGVLHQQVIPIELAASGAITGITSSNSLTLTIGAY